MLFYLRVTLRKDMLHLLFISRMAGRTEQKKYCK